jgi:two-component system chemotaxis response regulator CheY
MNILIIDDSKTMLSLVGNLLTANGYRVIEACNGKDGLLKLFKNHVDLIISDLNMPEIDGLKFVRKVRQSPLHRDTPVIMLTTDSEKDKVVEGITLGVKAWILKPFNNNEFLEAVKKILHK